MRPLMKLVPAFFLLSLMLFSCSDDDDYVYPDVITEFIDLSTDAQGTVNLMKNDAGKSWNIDPTNGLTNLKADTTYRVVAKYVIEPTNKGSMATIYSSQGVLAPAPILPANVKVKTDPVKIQSLWRGGDYINIILKILCKDALHKFHFIQDSLSDAVFSGKKQLAITLYHDQNNDVMAFYRDVYLSIPLSYYSNLLSKGDEIVVYINTYDNGVVKTTFNY